MVSLAQAGFDVNIRNIMMESPAPKVVSKNLLTWNLHYEVLLYMK